MKSSFNFKDHKKDLEIQAFKIGALLRCRKFLEFGDVIIPHSNTDKGKIEQFNIFFMKG